MSDPAGTPAREPRQLLLDLGLAPSYAVEDFLVSASNEAAYSTMEAWPAWPDRVLLLVGPPGSGKSHLAAIWAATAGARFLRTTDLDDRQISRQAAVLEDCDRRQLPEPALFHLLNLIRQEGGWLVMTARVPPGQWGLKVPDLVSRLRLATLVQIEHPDERLIRSVIVKLFADRQIKIDDDVVSYASRHCEQSLAAVNRFVAAADEEALRTGRRITRPLVSRLLNQTDEQP